MALHIEEDVPLARLTTLGIGGTAQHFVSVSSREDLVGAIEYAEKHNLAITVIGGGSNMLVSDTTVQGLVVQMSIPGITYEVVNDSVRVTAGAGVMLDELVADTVKNALWGLENLSGIPGTVGGVPIQNVGAYGVEASDVVTSVDVYDRVEGVWETRSNKACMFSYRDSVFKQEGKNRFIVVGVTFLLSRTPHPRLSYKDLKTYFGGNTAPALGSIREAVLEIRRGKFPDWTKVGTAGSFFKNPIIPREHAAILRKQYPDIPLYEEPDGRYKVALGWILDRVLNLKGYREGNVGLYEKQALVLVNFGGATMHEVDAFSERVIKKIFDATNLKVEREVVVIT